MEGKFIDGNDILFMADDDPYASDSDEKRPGEGQATDDAYSDGSSSSTGGGQKFTDVLKKNLADARKFLEKQLKAIWKRTDKNAYVAAVLNIMFWGLGYVFNRVRWVFGLLLMLSEMIIVYWLYLNPTVDVIAVLADPIVGVAGTVFFIALGFDAYTEARNIKKESKTQQE